MAERDWLRPADIRKKVEKLWAAGRLLALLVPDGDMAAGVGTFGTDDAAGTQGAAAALFPLRLSARKPLNREVDSRPDAVRRWIRELCEGAQTPSGKLYGVEWVQITSSLGRNPIPEAVVVPDLESALALAGKTRQARRFAGLVAMTKARYPVLLPWMARRALKVLELADEWPSLLAIVDWMRAHPRSNLYLRQMDVPGVHTKFVERHRGILAEMLDLVLPGEAIDQDATGAAGFCRRYGLREKPALVRFRFLDEELRRAHGGFHEQTLTSEDFAGLRLACPVRAVFILENETNFLAFPEVEGGLALFGSGYGFDNLARAAWLQALPVHYWGDLDTHGFAILNQARAVLPQAVSFLMDEATLLACRDQWVVEDRQGTRVLERLNREEQALYGKLCRNELGERVRLEQERIGFGRVLQELRRLGFTVLERT